MKKRKKHQRRKRTNSKVPAKGRLRDMADQLWSLAVKDDWNHQCAICNHRGTLDSHHLIPRQYMATRYSLANGICLCRRCHQFCPERSPHQNAAGFISWLWARHPSIAEMYLKKAESFIGRSFDGVTNAQYYCELIVQLKEYVEEDDYRRIVGVRFAEYLESQE